MKEWVQKKKRAEEMGKGPFATLFDKEDEGGVSLPFFWGGDMGLCLSLVQRWFHSLRVPPEFHRLCRVWLEVNSTLL